MTESHLLGNYNRFPVEFTSGEGVWLTDSRGNRYLDFLSGIAVNGFGTGHPEITAAVLKQLNGVWHTSNLFESAGQKELASVLASKSGLEKVFFCNSGTEANEAAIKFARKWGQGRYHIITAQGGFHGRTMGSLSASGQPKLWNGFFPLVYGFTSVQFGSVEAIRAAITSETVAVMLEPIQGENGILLPPAGYLKAVREVCDEFNLLLILDEVQSGMGRTGKWFAFQHEELKPDILTLAKGIANGFPLGAVICTEPVGACIKPGDHGSTFGGNPVAVAAALAVSTLLTEDILDGNLALGEYLRSELASADLPEIAEIRGLGLMTGIQLKPGTSARALASSLLEQGIVTGTSGDSVLRLLPPFLITRTEIDLFVSQLAAVFEASESRGVAV
ncbi:MAG: acetylornithine transaminase [Bacteroidetes bacterium]|nr:acetylornithine transaminase [Bacteroidota bacterium]